MDNVNAREENMLDTGLKHKVAVKLYGSIRAAAGIETDEIEIPSDCAAYEVLQLLSGIYGDEFTGEVFRQAERGLRDDLTVSVDGVITEHTKLEGLRLFDGAVIALLPTFPGGG